ncbi:hypothetical protein [Glycomyces xiaoerkulensis]|uniref:hypothetical protein n=1 Tax=Glycomyces xiaoerkulensis TaxID=2038139 RepID=UPI0012FFE65E|nr:hypothetical protein [Glycomyces xiaoerkulensis]
MLDLLPFLAVAALTACGAALLLTDRTNAGIAVGSLAAIALSGQVVLAAHRASRRYRALSDAIRQRGDESLGSTEVERIEFLQRRILAAFESERMETAERFQQLRSGG